MPTPKIADLFEAAAAAGELGRAAALVRFSTENAQRFLKLQMEMAQQVLAESVKAATLLSQATEPQQALALRLKLAQQGTESLMQHAQRLQQAALAARQDLSTLYLAPGGKGKAGADPLQALYASAGEAVEALAQAGRDASERAQASLRGAAAGFPGAAPAAKAKPAARGRRAA